MSVALRIQDLAISAGVGADPSHRRDRDGGGRGPLYSTLGATQIGDTGQVSAKVLPILPFADLIKECVENEMIPAARSLVQLAMQQENPGPAMLYWHKVLAPARVRKSPKKDFDRSAELQWLKDHAAEYRGLWVAVLGNNLVASASTLKELQAKVREANPQADPLAYRLADEPACSS